MNFVEKKLLNRILDFFSILKILLGYQKTISGLFLLKILVFFLPLIHMLVRKTFLVLPCPSSNDLRINSRIL